MTAQHSTVSPKRRLLLWWSGTLFLAQFVAAVISHSVWAFGANRIETSFDVDHIDAGLMPCGEDWNGTIVLRNQGTLPIRVLSVSKSCGCTSTSLKEGVELQPGATKVVRLKIAAPDNDGQRVEATILVEYGHSGEDAPKLTGIASAKVAVQAECFEPVVDASTPTPVPDGFFSHPQRKVE